MSRSGIYCDLWIYTIARTAEKSLWFSCMYGFVAAMAVNLSTNCFCMMKWDGAVSIMTRLKTECRRRHFFYLCKDGDCIISTASRMNLGHTQPTFQWASGSFIPRDKVTGAQNLLPHVRLLYLQSAVCLHVTVVNSAQRHQLPVHEEPKMCSQCCYVLDFLHLLPLSLHL